MWQRFCATDRAERVVQDAELVLAADDRAGRAGASTRRPARRRRAAGTREPARALPFSGSGSTSSTIDRVAHQHVRRLADQDLHRRRVLLQAGGGVDGVAGDQSLSAGDVAGHDLAGVHARPVLQADAVPLEDHLVDVDEAFLHLERGPDGADGVVLVQAGEPEHGHDRVADVLLDPAAVPFEDQPHLVEIQVQDLAEVLAVQALAERGGALQVREHDGDGAADLFDGDLGSERRCRRSRTGGSDRGSLRRNSGRSARQGVYAGPLRARRDPTIRRSDATLRVAGRRQERDRDPGAVAREAVLATALLAAQHARGRRLRVVGRRSPAAVRS